VKQSMSQNAPAWLVDYSAARARAIKWLGDRYLLAKPINASEIARRKTPIANYQLRASDP